MKIYLCLFGVVGVSLSALAQPSKLTQVRQEIAVLEAQKPSLGRDTLLTLALYECGRLYSESKTPDSANFYINWADTLVQRHPWRTGEGIKEYRIGNYYMTLGLATVATEHFLKALKHFQDVNDIWRQSQTYNYLGVNTIHNDFSDTASITRGINLLGKSYQLAKKGGYNRAMAAALINTIHAYLKIGEHWKALEVAQLMPKNFTWPNPLFSWTIMAVCYAHTGNRKEYHRLLDSIATRKNLSAYERYYTNFEFGALELSHKNLAKAQRYAMAMSQAAMELYIDPVTHMLGPELITQETAQKQRADKKILEAELLLYQVYKARNKTNLALQHLERAKALEKKLAAKTSKQVVEEMQLKYDAERIQAENERTQQARTQNFLLVGLGLLTLFAGYAVWSNRQLRQKNRQISESLLQGQTLERRRVAADLHDSFGGLIASLRWQMQQVDERTLDEKQRGVFQNTLDTLTDAHQRVRLISHNLLPDELEKEGLAQSLRHLVDALNRAGGIQVDLELGGLTDRLPKQTEFEVYSIALELLTNVLRHAGATEAFLALERQNSTLHLTVSDNGQGWDGQTTDGKGWRNVRDRVNSLHGTVRVRPRAGQGTEVAIVVPVNRHTETSAA